MLFNDNWSFQKRPIGSTVAQLDEDAFVPVEIPHDYLIYDTRNLYETTEGWYRKTFTRPEGERVTVLFDGVYMNTTIYLNRKPIFEWKYGYSAFEVDLTPHLIDGENELLVQTVYQEPNSRWYSGAGIYRDVHLHITEHNYLPTNGVYITPVKNADGSWQIQVDTEVCQDAPYTLTHTAYDQDGNVVAQTDTGNFTIAAPRLWSPDNPHVYTLETVLKIAGRVVDTARNPFGLRTIRYDLEEGLFVNDVHVKLHGVCEHHDLGSLGAAFNVNAMRRKLNILQSMGVNALRTSHNMPAKEVMTLCDEMGIIVISEAFDMWVRPKTEYDYARFFPEWMPRDVRSWIRRDRNHPSIIMWSIGNEIYDTHADVSAQDVTVWLRDEVIRHDPKRHALVTIGSNYMPWEGANKCADLVDAAGYNYLERYYDAHHAQYPNRIIYGSETASTVQSRGIYHFPLCQSVLADDDTQCSALGNSTTSWAAKNSEYCITKDRDAQFSLGQFIWTGFDYIGEPTPYRSKNSYFGQIDTAGFPKDTYYLYRAAWTDYKKAPMVHIFPYWDFSPEQPIDVRVCSNAPKVELFLDDKSLGTCDIDHLHGETLGGNWILPYREGELRAVAYDEMGNVIATDVQRSFKDAKTLVVTPDKSSLNADGKDLIFIEISAEDEQGNPVHNANNRVEVTVSGAGRLVGLDNGDSADYDAYKGTSRRLFSGKLLAIIAATYDAGDIKVECISKGLETKVLHLTANEANVPLGSADTLMRNADNAVIDELPIRKITLTSQDGFELSEDKRQINVQAEIFPHNATYRDITWRLTNRAGVDTNVAKLDVNGLTATIHAIGDGEIWLRAMAHNGREDYECISQQRFNITGLGSATLDPYSFISGGIFSRSDVPVTNGNERGVATLRDDASHIAFDYVDFGSYGADTVTIPIFTVSQESFPIEIWEGMPGDEGSALVDTVIYDRGSIWNTYIPQTFKLSRRFRGLTTLCLVVNRKIHIKGFQFEQPRKAADRLMANACDAIYGDSFTRTDDAILGIGNNVSVSFQDMAFDGGDYRLSLCGRTKLDKNTLQVELNDGVNAKRHLVEFKHAEDYQTQVFDLSIDKGCYTVTFIFLPGCQFDFQSFQFAKVDA